MAKGKTKTKERKRSKVKSAAKGIITKKEFEQAGLSKDQKLLDAAPVESVKGVGETRGKSLRKRDVETVGDLRIEAKVEKEKAKAREKKADLQEKLPEELKKYYYVIDTNRGGILAHSIDTREIAESYNEELTSAYNFQTEIIHASEDEANAISDNYRDKWMEETQIIEATKIIAKESAELQEELEPTVIPIIPAKITSDAQLKKLLTDRQDWLDERITYYENDIERRRKLQERIDWDKESIDGKSRHKWKLWELNWLIEQTERDPSDGWHKVPTNPDEAKEKYARSPWNTKADAWRDIEKLGDIEGDEKHRWGEFGELDKFRGQRAIITDEQIDNTVKELKILQVQQNQIREALNVNNEVLQQLIDEFVPSVESKTSLEDLNLYKLEYTANREQLLVERTFLRDQDTDFKNKQRKIIGSAISDDGTYQIQKHLDKSLIEIDEGKSPLAIETIKADMYGRERSSEGLQIIEKQERMIENNQKWDSFKETVANSKASDVLYIQKQKKAKGKLYTYLAIPSQGETAEARFLEITPTGIVDIISKKVFDNRFAEYKAEVKSFSPHFESVGIGGAKYDVYKKTQNFPETIQSFTEDWEPYMFKAILGGDVEPERIDVAAMSLNRDAALMKDPSPFMADDKRDRVQSSVLEDIKIQEKWHLEQVPAIVIRGEKGVGAYDPKVIDKLVKITEAQSLDELIADGKVLIPSDSIIKAGKYEKHKPMAIEWRTYYLVLAPLQDVREVPSLGVKEELLDEDDLDEDDWD